LRFTEFNLNERLQEGIEAIGFEEATPIQEQTIPPIIEGSDVIASAQTGTGKTAAFLLPLIHNIITGKQQDGIKAMVIVPTRELAVQIDQQMEGLSYFTSVSSIAIYGGGDGSSFSQEKHALREGVDVVICTPGKMIAHLNMGYVDLSSLQWLVLDEADRMLDIGFYDDIMKIISNVPKKRQTLLFSATVPFKIRQLARKILQNPFEVNIAVSKPPEKIRQGAYVVYDEQKNKLAKKILKEKNLRSVIVFCSTKSSAKQLARELKKTGMKVEDIHSDLLQDVREQVLLDFKNRKLNILVATDILARGIDVEDIDLVINFDVPNDGEDYVHRIGRTARAQSDGEAITFINEKEQYNFKRIENLLGYDVEKLSIPEEFGEGPEYNPEAFKKKRPFRGNRNKGKGGKRPNQQKANFKPKAKSADGDARPKKPYKKKPGSGKPKPKPQNPSA